MQPSLSALRSSLGDFAKRMSSCLGWRRVRNRVSQLPTGVLLFILCSSIYLACGRGRIVSADAMTMFAVTKSIVDERALSVSPDASGTVRGKDGRYYAISGIGKSLANVPFYVCGKLLAVIYPRYPESYYCILCVSTLNPLLSALTVALLFVFCRRLGLTERESTKLAAIYGFCTIAFPYAKDDMSEPLAAVLLLSGIYCAYTFRQKGARRYAVLAGMALGLAATTRYVLSLASPIATAYFSRKVAAQKNRSGTLQGLAFFLLVLIAFAVALACFNYLRFGGVLETGYDLAGGGLRGFTFRPADLLSATAGLLVSPGRGLFFYMPILLLALAGFKLFYKVHRDEAMLLAATFVSFLVLQSGYTYWTAGASWGPRYLLPEIALVIPFLGFAFRLRFFRTTAGKALVTALIVVSFLVQFSAVIVPWERYIAQIAVREYHGERADIVWDISSAQPIVQWREIAEVLSIGAEDRRRMRYDVAIEHLSADDYFKSSRGMNTPDFWFVHFYYLGVPSVVIAVLLISLLTPLCLSFALLVHRHSEGWPETTCRPKMMTADPV